MPEPLIFEKGSPGRRGYSFPPLDVPNVEVNQLVPGQFLRATPPQLPEVSEVEVVRHYVRLSRENYGVDVGFYPLGSCTMKYNPKINEDMAQLAGFSLAHPLQAEGNAQGALRLIYELECYLKEISGMDRVSLQPAAGAQGELAGMLMIRAHHEAQGRRKTKVLIPDSAHGTNPASAALVGYQVQVVRSNVEGLVDLDDLKRLADEECAALMLTNPNTLGLFERDILKISNIIHEVGGLMYLDGANLNALLGLVRPGDMGFDVVHFNLHKTFSTPHGGGGPGAGPVGVKEALIPYLPAPTIEQREGNYYLDHERPSSIGRLHAFYGNFGILVRAYSYIRRLGARGLSEISRAAIINANYIRTRLNHFYHIPFNRPCMHECILSAKRLKQQGVHAWDIAKRLIDYGVYPPTVNFPLVVEEAIMIEPPESESVETLDTFCEAMITIAREAEQNPEMVKEAPHSTPLARLDEVLAARKPDLRWTPASKVTMG
jgi:glycine dehydrogenase subunit 2